MLGGERERLSDKGNYTLTAVVLSKALRALAFVGAATVLQTYDWPVTLFLFYVLAGSAIGLALQRPGSGKRAVLAQQWSRVGVYAITIVFNYLLFFVGLKYFGPLRAILSYDYADVAFAAFFTTVFSAKGRKSTRLKGAALSIIAYLLLSYGNVGSRGQATENVDLFLFKVHSTHLGAACLFGAAMVSLLRKNLEKVFSPQIGTKRLFCMSMIAAAVISFPFAAYDMYSFNGVGLFTTSIFPRVLATVIFAVIIDFHIESHINPHSNSGHFQSYAPTLSLAVSVLTVIATDLNALWLSPFFIISSFALLLLGVSAIFTKK